MAKDNPAGMQSRSRRPGPATRAACLGSLMFVAAAMAACNTGSVLSLEPAVDVGAQTAALPQPTVLQSIAPSNPIMASYPRLLSPMPEMEPDVLPSEEIDCRRELKRLGVTFRDVDPIHEGACGIDHPVQVSAIGSVEMKPSATLTCAMAQTFARWTKKELVPSARRRYFSGVKTIHQGSSYSCRKIADSRGVLSEHGKGNALDIMRIELNNGKDIDVRKQGFFAFRARGFLNTVRADGCQYFNTVLGPGYNADHANHFHFDIKARRNNHVACR